MQVNSNAENCIQYTNSTAWLQHVGTVCLGGCQPENAAVRGLGHVQGMAQVYTNGLFVIDVMYSSLNVWRMGLDIWMVRYRIFLIIKLSCYPQGPFPWVPGQSSEKIQSNIRQGLMHGQQELPKTPSKTARATQVTPKTKIQNTTKKCDCIL